MTALLVVLAGSLGAATRFVVDGEARHRWPSSFPWATALINVTGSALLGVVLGLVQSQGAPDALRLVVGVGFCGGYTTFSTASVETVRLAQQGRVGSALTYALVPLVLSVGAAAAGFALVSAL